MKTYKEYMLIESSVNEIDLVLSEVLNEDDINEILGFAISDNKKDEIMKKIVKAANHVDDGLMLVYDIKRLVIKMLKDAKSADDKKVLSNVAKEIKDLILHGSGTELQKSSLLDKIESTIAKS